MKVLGFSLIVMAAGCDFGSEASSVDPHERGPFFQTDSFVYQVGYQERQDFFLADRTWSTLYSNDSDSATYLDFCAGQEPWPYFQRFTGGEWLDAGETPRALAGPCETRIVAPGDSLRIAHVLGFSGRLFRNLSSLPTDSMAGTYRLVFEVFGSAGDPESGGNEADLLDAGARVSNEFEIVVHVVE